MKKRILVVSNTIGVGGAETFIMKVFRTMDKEKYVFDFLVNDTRNTFYLNEIQSMGGVVYYGISKSKNILKCYSIIKNTVNNGGYKTVLFIAVHPIGFIDVLAAKMGGAKQLLVRSTNSHAGGLMSPVLAIVSRPLMRLFSSAMFSPSVEAANWLFGKRSTENGSVVLLKNGVDTTVFYYDERKRKETRMVLGIDDETLLVGHVGRFNTQKNHLKLIDVFYAIKSMNGKSKLVLVGDGQLKEKIKSYVNDKGLIDDVTFLGIRQDVPDLLCAFDVMVFPSLFEGMPNTIIEAQACNLPCVISDTISRDVKITKGVKQMSLKGTDIEWAKTTLNAYNKNRYNNSSLINESGYSIKTTTDELTKYFM